MLMLELGKLIEDISIFDKYIEITEGFEEISAKAKIPRYPHWFKYLSGNVLFAVNMKRNSVLNELLDNAEVIFREIIPMQYPINRATIHLMKTIGNVKPHCDQSRLCAINIGLRNSSSAITRVGTDDVIDFSVKEGYGYLLNTKQRHSVIGSEIPRYILSYSLDIPYPIFSKEVICR